MRNEGGGAETASRFAMSKKIIWEVLLLSFMVGTYWAQEKKEEAPAAGTPASPHNLTISPEDSAKKNPIKFTATSVERGKKIYLTQCALCHGDGGDGKGDLATEMKLTLPDFTKADTLKKRTDGDLFAIISSGKDPMPGQGNRMTEQHRWNLVNFLRAVGGNTPEKATGKEPEENVILVPEKAH
jgi:mono/diheme cytochrome c family protein